MDRFGAAIPFSALISDSSPSSASIEISRVLRLVSWGGCGCCYCALEAVPGAALAPIVLLVSIMMSRLLLVSEMSAMSLRIFGTLGQSQFKIDLIGIKDFLLYAPSE